MTPWTLIVPVKGTPQAKSRLGDQRVGLALAIALDTVGAARAANGVRELLVVTTGAVAASFEALGARVVLDSDGGLAAAIDAGLALADGGIGSAVLLGDVPALRPEELASALAAAAGHPLSFVADAEGTGTVLVAAGPGHPHRLAFGPGSAAAHRGNGYVELVGDWPGLRRDVDLPEHLHALELGPRTAAYLAG